MLNQEIYIPNCSPSDVYRVFTSSKLHTKLIGDKSTVDARVGGMYSAFSGYAVGEYTKLVKNKLIEQTWRANDWPKNHYSYIKFEFTKSGKDTKINFIQENLPKGTVNEFETGWRENYWNPLILYFNQDRHIV